MPPIFLANSAGPRQENVLALEHALVMLLLLVGLLNIQREQRRYTPWVVLAGVALSLLTPIHTLEVAWPIMSALVLPPLLWQVAVRLAMARPTLIGKDWLVWLLTAAGIGLALHVGARLSPAGALLLGILGASLIWQVREHATENTDLAAFGQLGLAFLLAEIDVTLHPLRPLLGSLFAGAMLGLLIGYGGVRVALRLPPGDLRNYFCIGLAYLAYVAGALMGSSGVVTTAMTGLMIATYGYSMGLWPTTATLPAPLNMRGIFALMAAIFLLLGWQAQVPLTASRIAGIGLGVAAAAGGILVGQWLAPGPKETVQSAAQMLLRQEWKVFLLLLGTLLLWPQEAVVGPWPLIVALLAALVTVGILRILLHPVFDLAGIEVRQQEATRTEDPGSE